MRLKVLEDGGAWRVVAAVDDKGVCDVEHALRRLGEDRQTQATASGFLAQFQRIPAHGPQALPALIYHQIDANNEIFEFIKRDHRILCFEAAGRIVVCSHVFLKDRRRTSAADKNRAIELRKDYLAAEKIGNIVIVDDE